MDLILKKNVPEDFNLFLFGDDHEGTLMRHVPGWERMINHMHTSIDGLPVTSNYAVDHGDIMEGVLVDHPYYDPKTFRDPRKPTAYYQMTMALKNRVHMAPFLVTILDGQHTRRFEKFGDVVQIVVNNLRRQLKSPVVYGTWSCKIHWSDTQDRLMFKSFHTHGQRAISSTADDPKRRHSNMKLILKRHMRFKHADTVLMCKGHTHKLIICEPEPELFLYDDGVTIEHGYTKWQHNAKFIHADMRWYVNTGSFLKLYHDMGMVGYAERAEYDPVELGYAVCKVRNREIEYVEKVAL